MSRPLWAAPSVAALASVCATAHAADRPDPRSATVAPVVVSGRRAEPAPLAERTVTDDQIRRQVNALTAEDAIKYLPNIFVRRRHIGDTQSPVTSRTSGVGASARSLVYADGVLLSALIGNNNSNASPRWGTVSPAEIEQVTVSYGPFRAAYPGNAIGVVIDITTRTPQRFEASGNASFANQGFSQYDVKGTYRTYDTAVGVGDRRGPVWWRLSFDRLESNGQPLSYISATRSAATLPAVTGGYADVNRTGQPIAVVGAGGLEHQIQTTAKLKVGAELPAGVRVSYLVARFGHQDEAKVQSFLTAADGRAAYSGALSLNGATYNVAATAFATGRYRLEQTHWMQGLTLTGDAGRALDWSLTASAYDYRRDRQGGPTALPLGLDGGPGSVLDMSGTGWRTLDLASHWRPGGQASAHRMSFGGHLDRYQLKSRRLNTADWRAYAPGALAQLSLGRTRTTALWAEDVVRLAPALDLTLGVRGEWWRAYSGRNLGTGLDVVLPERSAAAISPKLTLGWRNEAWRASFSVGDAQRFPTVTELYQVVSVGALQRTPDPNLKPERARSAEVALERTFGPSRVRVAAFTERVRNALVSQSTPLPGSGATVSFVQNVGETRANGAEVVADLHDVGLPGLDVSGSATFVDARTVRNTAFPASEGKRSPQVPRWRWTAVATWRATPRLSLTAAARYSDRSFGTIDNTDIVSHTYQGFDGYFVADARAVLQLTPEWSASLGVDNLTDRRYFLFHPFPGRTLVAQLSWRARP